MVQGGRGRRSQDVLGSKNPMYGRTGEDAPTYGKRGEESPTFTGWYNTPFGVFGSTLMAQEHPDADVAARAIHKRCKDNLRVISSYNLPKEWKGKTWKELGWSFTPKSK